jgi:hypothetical protein
MEETISILNNHVDDLIYESECPELSSYAVDHIKYCNVPGTNREFNSCFMMRVFFFYDYIKFIKKPMIENNNFALAINYETGELLLDKSVQWYEHKLLSLYYQKSIEHNFQAFPDDHMLFIYQLLSFISYHVEAQIILQRTLPDTENDPSYTFLMRLLEKRKHVFASNNMNFVNAFNTIIFHIESIVRAYTMQTEFTMA